MRIITRVQIDQLLHEAQHHPRQRVIFRLHEHHEKVQRMVNAMHPGTYITPHKHQDPDKVELFNIMVGRVAVLHFDEVGEVLDIHILDANGAVRVVDIPPRTYHTLIPLQPSVLLEIIEGPYDPETHKRLAPWAPTEDNPKAPDFRMYLTSVIHNWRGYT
jgi:cupin fold WbuC family metalloprotein